jgi:hypothetical protein
MSPHSMKNPGYLSLILLASFLCMLAIIGCVVGEVNYDLPPYQDPAGDVLEFNETWSQVGQVDNQSQIDIKWLRSSNDSLNNVVLRMEFKSKQVIEISNETRYVYRIFTKADNSTGYNITHINGSTTISNLNNTLEEDMTANTSIIDEQGEILVVKVSKSRYLNNITYFNIDAYTWKEQGNYTYIDYVSEIPGHPGATGTVVEDGNGEDEEDKGFLGFLCALPLILWILVIIIIVVIIAILLKRRI